MFQIARGALLAFSSAMAFAALRRMPVAEFTAIVMLTPVVATLVARVWLKERISPLRWALVVGGFIGALLAVPLTAAVKVLFRRFIWERQLRESPEFEAV